MTSPPSAAVVLALAATTGGTPTALLTVDGQLVVSRVTTQLRSRGIVDLRVVTRPEWVDDLAGVVPRDVPVVAAAGSADLRAALDAVPPNVVLGIVSGDLAAHAEAIAAVLVDPRRDAAVLAAPPGSAGFSGLLRLAPGRRVEADVAGVAEGPDVEGQLRAVGERSGATPVAAGPLVAMRVTSEAEAAEAARLLAAVDEEQVRLDAAVKDDDGFFATFLVSPYSRHIARWAARRSLTPNQVTVASMVIGLTAAAAFATGSRSGLIAGAVALQVSFVADCVDGQLARYTRHFTTLGAWLDATFDRGKETAVLAGLAIGGVRGGDDLQLWLLAAAALALQAVRHMVLLGYRRRHADQAGGAPGAVGLQAAERFDQHPVLRWAKRIVVLPIGERFALISVTAALATPRVTFLALLGWGLVALAYTLAGRLLRAGTGPWLTPAAARTVEYGTVLGAALASRQPVAGVAAFALLAVVAFHHYDAVHRELFWGESTPRWLEWALLRWEGRSLVALAAAAAGAVVGVLGGLAVWCGVLVVGESLTWLARTLRDAGAVPVTVPDAAQ